MGIFTWHAQFTLNFLISQQSIAICVSIPILFSDVDECSLNGTCPEHSTCANTFGSFVCTCNEGFMRNGSVCIGKDCLWVTTTCMTTFSLCIFSFIGNMCSYVPSQSTYFSHCSAYCAEKSLCSVSSVSQYTTPNVSSDVEY